jgi:hypothetical protein
MRGHDDRSHLILPTSLDVPLRILDRLQTRACVHFIDRKSSCAAQ